MSLFMIETGNVDSTSSAVGKIVSQISDLSSSVSGYDTSCEDGFDFASAKNVIASNVEACVIKVKNTSSILNTVSQTHTQLQSSLKYKQDQSDSKSGKKSSSGGSSSGGSYSGGGGYYGGGSYSGGGGYSSVGKFGNVAKRRVNTIFDKDIAPWSNMVLGEVLNDRGNWSGFLPHRHPQEQHIHCRPDRSGIGGEALPHQRAGQELGFAVSSIRNRQLPAFRCIRSG